MEEEDVHHQHNSNNQQNNPPNVKPILRRSKSERSDRMALDNLSMTNSSTVGMGMVPNKDGSILSNIQPHDPFRSRNLIYMKGPKASSVISGAELREPTGKKGKKSGSVISDSVVGNNSSSKDRRSSLISKDQNFGVQNVIDGNSAEKKGTDKKLGEQKVIMKKSGTDSDPPTNKGVDERSVTGGPPQSAPAPAIGGPIPKMVGPRQGSSKFKFGRPHKANSLWSDSEVGPSPSEVAAAVARKYPRDDNQSSVLDGWSLDESVEGLRSKLERWRTELPPLYDRGYSSSSFGRSTVNVNSHGGTHSRRHSNGESGMFSCFSNIYGYECQCICGRPPANRSLSSRFQSPSIGPSAGRSFL